MLPKKNHDENLWLGAIGNMMGTMILVIGLPMGVLEHLNSLIRAHDAQMGTVAEYVGAVILYFFGVYATYRQARWRQKNIPHLLRKKKKKEE
jgi:threonine/homoserine/homoserine lactone efflux protein